MSTQHTWQDWQLTAFVLNELDADLARQIASAQAHDPALAAEIQSLRSTLEQVSIVLKQDSRDSLDDVRRNQLFAKFEMEKRVSQDNSPTAASDEAIVCGPDQTANLLGPNKNLTNRRWMLIGLFASAACMLLAVMASAPVVSKWSLSHSLPVKSPAKPTDDGMGTVMSGEEALVFDDVGYLPTRSPEPAESIPAVTQEIDEGAVTDSASAVAQGANHAPRTATEGGMPGMMGMGGGNMGMSLGGAVSLDRSAAPQSVAIQSQPLSELQKASSAPLPVTSSLQFVPAEESELLARQWGYRSPQVFPGGSTDKYAPIRENRYIAVADEPLSTFSIDVDTASYTKVRQFLKEQRVLPPADAVRVEEMINYFDYKYVDRNTSIEEPFIAKLAVARSPWNKERRLVRVALQAKNVDMLERPGANIVFLIDVSGSMDAQNKLPLVKETMGMMIEQLGKHDRIAMVVYAGAAGCVLESTAGDQKQEILGALERLKAGGSTNGGEGIQLAYNLARDHFVKGGINRVILCTDGDFNVGVTSTNALVDMVAENAKSKIFLTVLGFGNGNTNDAMMEQIADRGNGVYGFVDSRREAKRQMVKQLAGNLITVAKDVKIQVEFNPNRVREYRLIGYENRLLENADFSNDQKDAGEVGAGHRVTVLYELIPMDAPPSTSPGEKLRYQPNRAVLAQPSTDGLNAHGELFSELLAVNLRYKEPEGDVSKLLTFPLQENEQSFNQADEDFRWAAAVAQFGMLLRRSEQAQTTWEKLLNAATKAAGDDPDAARQECLEMIEIAAGLHAGRQ